MRLTEGRFGCPNCSKPLDERLRSHGCSASQLKTLSMPPAFSTPAAFKASICGPRIWSISCFSSKLAAWIRKKSRKPSALRSPSAHPTRFQHHCLSHRSNGQRISMPWRPRPNCWRVTWRRLPRNCAISGFEFGSDSKLRASPLRQPRIHLRLSVLTAVAFNAAASTHFSVNRGIGGAFFYRNGDIRTLISSQPDTPSN
jgi:hypothetical protein